MPRRKYGIKIIPLQPVMTKKHLLLHFCALTICVSVCLFNAMASETQLIGLMIIKDIEIKKLFLMTIFQILPPLNYFQ